jgi:hypothetical protein
MSTQKLSKISTSGGSLFSTNATCDSNNLLSQSHAVMEFFFFFFRATGKVGGLRVEACFVKRGKFEI